MQAARDHQAKQGINKCVLASKVFTNAAVTDPGAKSLETWLSKLQVEPQL